MHHGDAILKMGERLKVQPLDELLTIGCVENVFQIIFTAGFARAAGNRHQMQIVIAQHHRHVVTVGIEPAQRLNVARTAVNQIAHTSQPVFIGIEVDFLEKTLEGLEATLDVADDVGAHGAMRKGRSVRTMSRSVGSFESRDKAFLFCRRCVRHACALLLAGSQGPIAHRYWH